MIQIRYYNIICIIIFLIIILLVIFFRNYQYKSILDLILNNNHNNHNNHNNFTQPTKNNDISTIEKTQLILFYHSDCMYSQLILPIWYQVLNDINIHDIQIIEQDCILDKSMCNKYNINTFPSIILVINNQQILFIGEISYNNLTYFLKSNGIYIRNTNIESFESADDLRINMKSICPIISFDHYEDSDKSYYQIFNERGQYGYSVGGYNELLTPYQAAYNTIDTYLSSLPNTTSNTASTINNMKKCADLYNNNIREFGLCNSIELNKMKQEIIDIKKNKLKLHKNVKKEDYQHKLNVISSIEQSCGL